MSLPKAVFWDWDGTLANTLPFLRRANNHVRQHFGMPDHTDEEFREILHYSTREGYARAYGDRAEEAMKVLYAFVEKSHSEDLEPIEGAEDILEYMLTLDIPMAVISNKRPDILEQQISLFGWNDFFVFSLGAGAAENDKPAADPLFMARDKIDPSLDMRDIWYVGDSETDLKAAENAQCPIVFFHGDQMNDQPYVETYKPILRIEKYTELREFLLQNR